MLSENYGILIKKECIWFAYQDDAGVDSTCFICYAEPLLQDSW